MKQEEEYLGRTEQLIWIIHPEAFPVLSGKIQTGLFKISCSPVQSLSKNSIFQYPLKHVKLFQCSFSSERKWRQHHKYNLATLLFPPKENEFNNPLSHFPTRHCPTSTHELTGRLSPLHQYPDLSLQNYKSVAP